MTTHIFVDSDVVISSLLSSSGAAYFLLHLSQIKPVITSYSLEELSLVVKKLKINPQKLNLLINQNIELCQVTKDLDTIKKEYAQFVTDINDAHIIAGAHAAKVRYLITYNLKHFKTDKIKDEFDILLMTPALFMQYLRSN